MRDSLITFNAHLGHLAIDYSLFKVTWTDTQAYIQEGKFNFRNTCNVDLSDIAVELSFSHLYRGVVKGDRTPTWKFDLLRPNELVSKELVWQQNFLHLFLKAHYKIGDEHFESQYDQKLDDSDDHESHGLFNIVTKIYDVNEQRDSVHLIQVKEKVDEELMRYFKQNPRHLYEIDPVLFERIIGNIFERLGFEVSYTGRTRDGGIDFFALDKNKNFRHKYIVQCKRYRSDRKISVEYIRELYGIKNVIPATKAILATTSFFTADAIKLGNQLVWDLDLKDYNDIVDWINKLY